MGPDQLYIENRDLILLKDIIPEKYHDNFESFTIMYDNLEYTTIYDLEWRIFDI